ncbi:general secretion pathway protein GspB [Marinobacter bryozoorum]|uniref:general secretion pathway protein GspB n=1 Tax=Marinobacter bryozoorum TaxID=256324 RepID=UPI0020060FF1|nr:general secretion pathway protein GspB [Marinobacter bryozoorum]MCK7544709.1 general secretion pathway protein GspB [Marinobacter bryozoorum]
MSYILEALKKSESERNQGRVPDLGQQVRMIHRRRRRGIPALAWLAIALALNAVVLAVLLWPSVGLMQSATSPETPVSAGSDRPGEQSRAATVAEPAGLSEEGTAGDAVDREPAEAGEPAEIAEATGSVSDAGVVVLDTLDEAPTVIVPTIRPTSPDGSDKAYAPTPWEGRVPHLVELPTAFQRQVPDLVFNSHVYSSQPSSRSVMINNRYLRSGDTLGPLRVERITEEGVELSMDGQRFRVGVVRDWSSPR